MLLKAIIFFNLFMTVTGIKKTFSLDPSLNFYAYEIYQFFRLAEVSASQAR